MSGGPDDEYCFLLPGSPFWCCNQQLLVLVVILLLLLSAFNSCLMFMFLILGVRFSEALCGAAVLLCLMLWLFEHTHCLPRIPRLLSPLYISDSKRLLDAVSNSRFKYKRKMNSVERFTNVSERSSQSNKKGGKTRELTERRARTKDSSH